MSTAEVPAQDNQTAPAPAIDSTATDIDPQTVPRSLPDGVVVPVQEPAEPVEATSAEITTTAPPTETTEKQADPAEPIKQLADEKEEEKKAEDSKGEPPAESQDAPPVESKGVQAAPLETVVAAAKSVEKAADVLGVDKDTLSVRNPAP